MVCRIVVWAHQHDMIWLQIFVPATKERVVFLQGRSGGWSF